MSLEGDYHQSLAAPHLGGCNLDQIPRRKTKQKGYYSDSTGSRPGLQSSAHCSSGSQCILSVGLDSGSAVRRCKMKCLEAGIERLIGHTADLGELACTVAESFVGIEVEVG